MLASVNVHQRHCSLLIDDQMDAAIEACEGKDAAKAKAELDGFLAELACVPKPEK